ncbi:MAG: ATP-binding protein [Burkholderiales bacterium]|nr:ATP-binding protein [Nitrosomonadaceae bacterium]
MKPTAPTPTSAPASSASVPFVSSVRAKFLLAATLLLAVPVTGVLYLRELSDVLRLGQEQVAVSATKLIAAALSDRPGIALRKSADSGPAVAPPEGDASFVGNGPDLELARERERLLALFSASDANLAAALGSRYQPDPAIERILTQSVVKDARVWVFDIYGNVRGIGGALTSATNPVSQDWVARMSQALLADHRASAVVENIAESTEAIAQQAQRAILGQPTREWRRQRQPSIGVVSVAEPVWRGDNIVGSVVLEESDTSQRALARRAAETVMIGGGVVLLVAIGGLLWFAFSVVRRITRLQRHAAEAVDVQGRIRHELLNDSPHRARASGNDEIDALAQTLESMVARQARYNQYLEQLAARLSHELRTPVAVVRSSLDNMRSGDLSEEAKTYLTRADEGVSRLSTIISRMSEATQLERMLQGAERERLDLAALVSGCVEGYRLAFPSRHFVFDAADTPLFISGAPDAIAQMLDKLAQNAADFAREGTPITVRVARENAQAVITIENIGPPLPNDLSTLFESMVSVRAAGQSTSTEAHLGLGLYVARLVAEHHRGNISARNRDAGDGVVFRVVLAADL